ncbi:MAG TPA: transposase, partial [Candidatus Limnocylindrales bacterium]|nr:transposase [Candidatus Limnocylindrales bacterium]
AGLATTWSHHRAHRFFSAARWGIDQIGLTAFDLVLTHLVADDAEVHLAVDDTAHRRRGKKVHGVGWIHDGCAPARNKLALGHRWVVVGVIARVPLLSRPWCLPVLCRRWRGKGTASTVDLATQMITIIAGRVPGRRVHVVADAAYHGKSLTDLPTTVTWTTRLPRNAVLYHHAPERTGKRGRPRCKGERIGTPAQAAATVVWQTASVARYGRSDTGAHRGARLPLVWRVRTPTGTDDPRPRPGNRADAGPGHHRPGCRPADLAARYAARWAIEVTFFDTRQTLGVGQARNRTAQAVNRTWAFGMYIYTIVVLWYALHGHQSGIVTDRRIHAPWYLSKTDPSFADMLTALRQTLIAARFMGSRPAQPTNAEIRQVQRAWALAAA